MGHFPRLVQSISSPLAWHFSYRKRCIGISLAIGLAVTSALVVIPSAICQDAPAPAIVQQGVPATVIADGEKLTIITTASTVAEALGDAGVALGELDRIEPALEASLQPDSVIRVTRVETETIIEESIDPSQVTVQSHPSLRQGLVLKLQNGTDGKIRQTIRIWRKDGVETTRDILEKKILKKRVDAVELRGTGPSSSLTSRSGGARRAITMRASAYDPGPRSCGKYADGYTANGMRAGKGVVAVDPRVIPLGTKLYIEGYGLAIAGDTGGAIKGLRIDLGYDTYAEAIRFGRRTVKVYILE